LSNALVALRSDWYGTARVNDYGITGSVDFIPYTEIVVREYEIPTAEPTTAPTTDENTSDTTTETTTDGEDVPKTGDELPYAALILTLVAVLAGGGIVLLRKSQKKENTQQDE
jgi:LPXTG-motif cell wall-anchored protein